MEITGVILAGGAGRRVGGQDKGLLNWQGRKLIAHVYDRLSPQVDELVICCNRNVEEYQAYTAKVVTDTRADYAGPLAGLEAAATTIETDYVVLVACDVPRLPPDLVTRLIEPLLNSGPSSPEICYANDGQRDQYLCAALRREVLNTLPAFLDQGGRAVRDWYHLHRTQAVDFANNAQAFANINTLPDTTQH